MKGAQALCHRLQDQAISVQGMHAFHRVQVQQAARMFL